jgi:hypothetical protein
MEVNEMQKWNIAYRIKGYYDIFSIIEKLENIDHEKSIKVLKTTISKENYPKFQPLPYTFGAAILDFEGSPVFMSGIMVHNTILTYYIEDANNYIHLYKLIFEILRITQDLWVFAFSDYERSELIRMYQLLKFSGYEVSKYEFITKLPITNFQRTNYKYESLTEAIYSLNLDSMETTGDPLFRNNKMVNKLFRAQKFDEIVAHNRNCLLNEALLLMKRWYKNYKLEGEKEKFHEIINKW